MIETRPLFSFRVPLNVRAAGRGPFPTNRQKAFPTNGREGGGVDHSVALLSFTITFKQKIIVLLTIK